jgi:hypothetical protein
MVMFPVVRSAVMGPPLVRRPSQKVVNDLHKSPTVENLGGVCLLPSSHCLSNRRPWRRDSQHAFIDGPRYHAARRNVDIGSSITLLSLVDWCGHGVDCDQLDPYRGGNVRGCGLNKNIM